MEGGKVDEDAAPVGEESSRSSFHASDGRSGIALQNLADRWVSRLLVGFRSCNVEEGLSEAGQEAKCGSRLTELPFFGNTPV